MTSAQLLGLLGGYQQIGVTQLLFGPGEVYLAATRAQEDILSEIRILEQTAQLALVAGQELYNFPPHAVTGATNDVPIVLTLTPITPLTTHPFNTGDEVVVFGVLGNVAANGRWIGTKISSTKISLDSSIGTINGTEPYTSGGMVYHALQAAVEIREEGIRKISDSTGNLNGTLKKRLPSIIELYRDSFGASSVSGEVINFQEIATEPITIGVQGIPGADLLTKVTYYRRPLPSEAISASVDPIIPSKYDELLELGTRVKMYSRRTEPAIHQGEVFGRRRIPSVYGEAFQLFLERKRAIRGTHRRALAVVASEFGGIEF